MTTFSDQGLLTSAGRALFGEEFVAPLANALRVDKSTVRKMTNGDSRVPPGVLRALAGIIQERERDTLPLPVLKAAVIEAAVRQATADASGPCLEIISPGGGLAEGVSLDVIGRADLSAGAELHLRFTAGPSKSGRVNAIEDGDRAVIEVEGKRWWLHRRNIVNVGRVAFHPWAVSGSDPSRR